MNKRIVCVAAVAAVAALGLSACSTTSQQAMAPITQAVAQGMPHCHISGSLNAGAGGLAGTGTGIAQNFTFDCPAQPWSNSATAPLPVQIVSGNTTTTSSTAAPTTTTTPKSQ